MKELNEEIKLTINTMQCDIDDGAHGELQSHLYSLLEMKRNELQQLLVERSWSEPVSGTIGTVTHDQAPYKSVKLDGPFCDPNKPLTTDQYMAGLAMVKDSDEAKPMTVEELVVGGWLCTDVSEECANALKSKNLRVFNSDEWGDDGLWVGCVMDACGDVKRKGIFFDFAGKKQIHRIGNEFYWSEK